MSLINLLIIAFLGLIIWAYDRSRFLKNLSLEYQYKLYTIRDELREQAILGNIDKDSWLFDLLDASTSKLISELPSLTIYYLIMLEFIYRKDKNIKIIRDKFDNALDISPISKKIFNKYINTVYSYICQKHKMTIFIYYRLIYKTILYIANKANNFRLFASKFGDKFIYKFIKYFDFKKEANLAVNSIFIYPEFRIASKQNN